MGSFDTFSFLIVNPAPSSHCSPLLYPYQNNLYPTLFSLSCSFSATCVLLKAALSMLYQHSCLTSRAVCLLGHLGKELFIRVQTFHVPSVNNIFDFYMTLKFKFLFSVRPLFWTPTSW